MASLEEGIVSILRDDEDVSALLGTRIYPWIRPQGTTFPAIVYELDGTDPEQDLVGYAGMTRAELSISCIDETYGGAKTLAAAALSALNGYTGIAGTVGDVAQGATIEVLSVFHIANGDTLSLSGTDTKVSLLTVGSGAGQILLPSGGTSGENNACFAGRIGAALSLLDGSPFSVSAITETTANDYEIVLNQNVAGTGGNTTPVIVADNGTTGWRVTANFLGGTDGVGEGVDINSLVHDNDIGIVEDSQIGNSRGVSIIESSYIVWYTD